MIRQFERSSAVRAPVTNADSNPLPGPSRGHHPSVGSRAQDLTLGRHKGGDSRPQMSIGGRRQSGGSRPLDFFGGRPPSGSSGLQDTIRAGRQSGGSRPQEAGGGLQQSTFSTRATEPAAQVSGIYSDVVSYTVRDDPTLELGKVL